MEDFKALLKALPQIMKIIMSDRVQGKLKDTYEDVKEAVEVVGQISEEAAADITDVFEDILEGVEDTRKVEHPEKAKVRKLVEGALLLEQIRKEG